MSNSSRASHQTYSVPRGVYMQWLCTSQCTFLRTFHWRCEAISVLPLRLQEAQRMQGQKMRKRCYVRILVLGDVNSDDFWIDVLNDYCDLGNIKVSVAFQNSHDLPGFSPSRKVQNRAKQYGSLAKWKYVMIAWMHWVGLQSDHVTNLVRY